MVSRPQVPQFSSGDVVRILDDIAAVHKLQEGHGGWVDDMALVSIYIYIYILYGLTEGILDISCSYVGSQACFVCIFCVTSRPAI